MYEKFEELLKKNNVTPYRVHKETGISTATLSDWKNGKSEPKKDKIGKICEYFNVPLSYFYGEDSEDGDKYYLNNETAEERKRESHCADTGQGFSGDQGMGRIPEGHRAVFIYHKDRGTADT